MIGTVETEFLDCRPNRKLPLGQAPRSGLVHEAGALRKATAALWRPVAIFLVSRIVFFAGARLATALQPGLTFKQALLKWDSGIWLTAIEHGWPHHLPMVNGHVGGSTAAFFPLYPLIVRAVVSITGLGDFVTALLVSALTGLGAAVLLWFFTRELGGDTVADRATALFCFYPGALVFTMAYSEGTLLVVAIPCLWALLRRQWLLAGCLAGLATAARPNALGLIPLCGLVALEAVIRRRDWKALIAPALSPVGVVAFVVFLHQRTGSWTAWPATERGWSGPNTYFGGIWSAIDTFIHHSWHPIETFILVGAVTIAVGLPLLIRARLPWPVWAYTVLALIPAIVSHISTTPRLVLIAFPLFIGAAAKLRALSYQLVLAMVVAASIGTTAFMLATQLAAP